MNPLIRTVSECAICQGYPEENVLQQYVQLDPTKAPIPIDQGDPLFLYEEEEEHAKSGKPWVGMLKPLFRAIGLLKEPEPEPVAEPAPEKLRSVKIAKSKKSKGAYER